MKQENKLKILPPTLREKHRYIKFRIISEEPVAYSDLEAALWQTLLDFYGELGTAELSLWLVKNLYDSKSQTGIIRCNNDSVSKVVAGLGLMSRLGESRLIVKVEKVSGTIKGLNL
ncbi:MAG: ribonuclease P protein component 2 [Candidatus Aenigmarchaeota archaeon]|nr:ribonuclease P protein component 2 [Candidatus Aenigmarchaeota archaeon]